MRNYLTADGRVNLYLAALGEGGNTESKALRSQVLEKKSSGLKRHFLYRSRESLNFTTA